MTKNIVSAPSRKKIRLSESAYFSGNSFSITINTYSHHPWFQAYPDLASSGANVLRGLVLLRKAKLYAWCIMPNHVHLLLQDTDIRDFVRLFKGKMVPRGYAMDRGRKLWQRSFYDHALRKEESLSDVAIYIWWNPVRKGIVDNPTKYPWSGSEVWKNWKEWCARV